jgi:hypothetical protein
MKQVLSVVLGMACILQCCSLLCMRCMCAAGHNLESTWLVADTLDYLLAKRAIDPAAAARYRTTAMDIGAAAVQQGYDAVHGGVFESGLPGQAPSSTLKVWWVQMESVMALYKLYEHSRDSSYLRKLAQSTRFVREHGLDSSYGEMYWQVGAVSLGSLLTNDSWIFGLSSYLGGINASSAVCAHARCKCSNPARRQKLPYKAYFK